VTLSILLSGRTRDKTRKEDMNPEAIYQAMLIGESLPITVLCLIFYLIFGFMISIDCSEGFRYAFGLMNLSDEASGCIDVIFLLFWPLALCLTGTGLVLRFIFMIFYHLLFSNCTDEETTNSWNLFLILKGGPLGPPYLLPNSLQ